MRAIVGSAATPVTYRINKRFVVDLLGCWIWIGAKWGSLGYGQIHINNRRYLVHRLMACIHFGMDYDDERMVLHRCNRPSCINPAHLKIGTRSDNTHDSVKAGTHNWLGKKG